MGLQTAALDPAHMLDKGISPNMIGSLFKDLTYEKALAPRGVLSDQVLVLWNLTQKFYDDTKVGDRLNKLELKDYCNPKSPHSNYPVFNAGSMTKCRRLVPFAAQLSRDFNLGSRRDAHRQCAFEALERVYNIILTGPDHLPDQTVSNLRSTIDDFLAHQAWLNKQGLERNVFVYNCTIKSHYLWHLGEDSKWQNPRLGWTYQDEDFVGRIAALCRSVTRSTGAVQRQRALLSKYGLAMPVRWQRQAVRTPAR